MYVRFKFAKESSYFAVMVLLQSRITVRNSFLTKISRYRVGLELQDRGKNYSLVPNNKNTHKGMFSHSATRARGRVSEMLYIFV